MTKTSELIRAELAANYQRQLAEQNRKLDSVGRLLEQQKIENLTSKKQQQKIINASKYKEKLLKDSLTSFRIEQKKAEQNLIQTIETIESESGFDLKMSELQVERYRAKTKADSLAIDKKELALFKTNQTLNSLMEREQAKKEAFRIKKEKIKRRNSIQYSGIGIGVFLLFGLVFLIGRIQPPNWAIELSVFLPFLILFEFLLVISDPYVDAWSGGEPLIKLGLNVLMAGAIFPLHSFFETFLKQRLFKSS